MAWEKELCAPVHKPKLDALRCTQIVKKMTKQKQDKKSKIKVGAAPGGRAGQGLPRLAGSGARAAALKPSKGLRRLTARSCRRSSRR